MAVVGVTGVVKYFRVQVSPDHGRRRAMRLGLRLSGILIGAGRCGRSGGGRCGSWRRSGRFGGRGWGGRRRNRCGRFRCCCGGGRRCCGSRTATACFNIGFFGNALSLVGRLVGFPFVFTRFDGLLFGNGRSRLRRNGSSRFLRGRRRGSSSGLGRLRFGNRLGSFSRSPALFDIGLFSNALGLVAGLVGRGASLSRWSSCVMWSRGSRRRRWRCPTQRSDARRCRY